MAAPWLREVARSAGPCAGPAQGAALGAGDAQRGDQHHPGEHPGRPVGGGDQAEAETPVPSSSTAISVPQALKRPGRSWLAPRNAAAYAESR